MKLPLEYRWLVAQHFDGYKPWYLIHQDGLDGLRKEYQMETGKDIYPFARRQDNDDIAGFEMVDGKPTSKVLTVHLTWSAKLEREGYPHTRISENMFDWISNIVFHDTQDWMSENELEDLNE